MPHEGEPRLPLELQDLTLHYLSDDRSTLIRSSLVCKDWRKMCTVMLFSNLDLSSGPGEKPGDRFKRFSRFTGADPSPPFLASVQHIRIDGPGIVKPKHIHSLNAERMGSLTSICVVGGHVSDTLKDSDYFSAVAKQFPSLKHLDLVTAFCEERTSLLELLSSLPNLRSLALGNMRWAPLSAFQQSVVGPDTGPLPPLEALRVTLKGIEHVDKYLLVWLGEQLGAHSSLRSLDYSVLAASPPADFSRNFLKSISSSVERLTLDFENGFLADDVLKNSSCVYARLTTLDLDFPIFEVKYGTKALDVMYPRRGRGAARSLPAQIHTLGALANALQHVDAPVLQDLTLRLYAEPDFDRDGRIFCSLGTLQSIDFSELDRRLSLCPFPKLRVATLVCGGVFAPAPFLEFFLFPGDHLGPRPYYIRAPVPMVGGRFEDVASAFLQSAFPLTMAQEHFQLRAIKGLSPLDGNAHPLPHIPEASPTMALEAPIEIVEIILLHLKDDIPALTRCSLVDRAWLSICRQLLFEGVDMTGQRMTSRHARFHKFMDLFEKSTPNAPCTFSQYVQRLQIDPTFTPYQISGLATLDLPNLQDIRIKAASVCVPAYLLAAVSTTFSEKIYRLDVTSLVFPTTSSLLEFLCGFPNLRELTLGDTSYLKAAWHQPSASLRLSPHIRSLRLVQRLGTMKSELIDWVIDQIRAQEIKIKSYSFMPGGWFGPPLSSLLAAVAGTVEEMRVEFNHSDDIEDLASPNLRYPNLRNLSLICTLPKPFYKIDWEGINFKFGRLFPSLQAPELTSLSLAFKFSTKTGSGICPMHALLDARLDGLDDALSEGENESLSALHNVKFLVEYCGRHPRGYLCLPGIEGLAEREHLGLEDAEDRFEPFDGLASQFLQEVLSSRTVGANNVALVVSRVYR
ncbi:hypothetical protein NMY22_g1407 [Coprinellus aureogranulatus]|nr:hypothetical protein NMY22_g1407 [Coprinellus aureogranulatus]